MGGFIHARAKVLVVDDEEQVLDFAQTVLRMGGFDALGATGGEQALAIMDNHSSVDVVLSDVRMPGMSGPELVKRVKRAFPATAVTLMTGDIGSEEIDSSVPCISKPFTPTGLLQHIQEVWAIQQDLIAKLKDKYLQNSDLIAKNRKLVAELNSILEVQREKASEAAVSSARSDEACKPAEISRPVKAFRAS